MKLLVAEKPSVATGHYRQMLERCAGESFVQGDGFLRGKEHCITWCVGHLVTLAPFDQYEGYGGQWQLGNLPLLPEKFKLMPIERTVKQLRVVNQLMNEADTLINGADAGREGNLIFDLVLDLHPELKKKEIFRLWVNSFVDQDLDKAWSQLETAQKRANLSYAARLRQRADWLVGLNATRAYTLTAGRGKLISVGRVQTPTLNLVVQRDQEVEGFQELFFYGVVGTWRGFKVQWYENDKLAFYDTPATPERVIQKCSGKEALIESIKKSKKKSFPKKPFDLTELQKEANKRFKMKVARTLEVAQELYEKKWITYPRTDSAYLTKAMKKEAYTLAQNLMTAEEKQHCRKFEEKFTFINDAKVTDHYAIIPTNVPPGNMTPEQAKVYALVKERFLYAWMKPYVWEETLVILRCEEEEFRLKLKRDIALGYKELEERRKKEKNETSEPKKESNDEDAEEEINNNIQEEVKWKKGESDPLSDLEVLQKKKAKPKYYTEATLLTAMKTAGKNVEDEDLAEAMKERGLGTPATQAGIIETLKKRGFILEEKNKIKSTEAGRKVIRLVDDQLKSPEMTGEWEFKLSQVEKGQYEPKAFYDDIVSYVKNVFGNVEKVYSLDFEREKIKPEFSCPKCAKEGRDGILEVKHWGYQCPVESCQFRLSTAVAERVLSLEETKKILAGESLENLEGFRSKRGFQFKAGLHLDEKFELVFLFDEEKKEEKRVEKCPRCKGELFESERVVNCKNEHCGFVIFKTVAKRPLQEKEIHTLLKKGQTEPLSGFVSKKGSSFEAALKLDESGKVVFDFPDSKKPNTLQKTSKTLALACPACGDRLVQGMREIYCAQAPCGLLLPLEFYGRKIETHEWQEVVEKGKGPVLSGFSSPKGNPFYGFLYINEQRQGKVDWNVPENKDLLGSS